MINKTLWALIFSLCSLTAQAQNKDFVEPVSVNSDNFDGSVKEKKLIYIGNVVVKQGSLLIKADRLEVDSSAGQGKEIFTAFGNQAVYSQLLDGDKPIQAMANEIRYEVSTRLLTLTGKAEINQSGSLVKSEKIQYDLEKQKLNAESGKDTERVTTIFTPEKK
ncbi:MAG: lipopolysaccharide transport periplasmic protein LptA [Gammaproteobacteria bacterium]|jgi:lipopolysaccharide export system protein LptA|nr:lipopolysaccharide transport periplasmic protein LptA [Gammaproteobacteria bacterium]MBU2222908.1 lipopolysaccharide transport periplasmic protein LptA [Gammaproteobacteria bacterium]MBU2425799.1 lipopolysaccharide transport periplasmic protein LptA [Gammaproteobacteria bacterium]